MSHTPESMCECKEFPISEYCTSCHRKDRNAGLNPTAYRAVVEAIRIALTDLNTATSFPSKAEKVLKQALALAEQTP